MPTPPTERRHTVPVIVPIEDTTWGKLQDERHAENANNARTMNSTIQKMLDRLELLDDYMERDVNSTIKKMLERLGLIDEYMERDIREHEELRTGVAQMKNSIGAVKTDTQSSVDTLKFLKTLGIATAWLIGIFAGCATIVAAYYAVRYGFK